MTRSIDRTLSGPALPGGTQAGYFRSVLTEQRSALDARIEDELRVLSARSRSHNTFGVKAMHRRIREMQKRRNELDRLLGALDPCD